MPADPEHDILPGAFRYEVRRIDWHLSLDDGRPFVDITFRRGEERRLLRFLEPRVLNVEPGYAGRCSGMIIYDISRRGWDGTRVQVGNFEGEPSITFYAADVVELDPTEETPRPA